MVFNIQRRMADYSFAKAESWEELVTAHEQWMSNYNVQRHWVHQAREDGRRSPSEILGFALGTRYHPEDLE